MKIFKNPAQFFVTVLGITVLCSFLTPFAFHRAVASDPDLEKKISEKYGVKFQFYGNSFSVTDIDSNGPDSAQDWSIPNKDQKIFVNIQRGDISVVSSDEPNIVISARGKAKSGVPLIQMTEDGESIILTESKKVKSVDIEIKVPKKFKGKFDLANISGDITATEISADTLRFKSISSDIELKDVAIEFVGGNNVNGEIDISSKIEFSADLNNVRGDVKVQSPKPAHTNFTLSSTRGDIVNPFPSAKIPKYRLNITTVNGDIDIQ